MSKVILICCIPFCLLSLSFSQIVETVTSHSEIRDGLHTDDQGNIYVASGGFAGFTIGKYDIQSDQFDPSFIPGFSGPVDVDFYQDSLFIVSNYDSNNVFAYNVNTGINDTIATGLDGPSGIVIDDADNIYVASWGGPPAYAGSQIHKIDASGSVSVYIDSPTLYRPQAMTLNQDGILVVYSQQKLYKVDPVDSTLHLWTTIGMKLGHMVFRQQDSCIYGTAIDLHKIVKIDTAGNLSTVAGTSIGYEDGLADSAKFRSPLGIELSPSEDTLYISEAGYATSTGRIRRILLNQLVSLSEIELTDVNLYPNPTKGHFTIENKDGEILKIEIFDAKGRLLMSKTENATEISTDLKGYAEGSYTVKMTRDQQTLTKQIIKI